MKTPITETLTELVTQILEDTDMFLVDLEVKGNDQNPQFGIYVDTAEGGVIIDQCAQVSRKLGFIIDAQEIITGKYTLNISSPGLDRPLKDRRQFAKNVGRSASVRYFANSETRKLKGVFSEMTDAGIVMVSEKKERTEILWGDLVEIKILPAF